MASAAFQVRGKTAIITGAGSGIGLCFASLLLSLDCNVLIVDLALTSSAQQLLEKYSHSQAENDQDSKTKARASFFRTDVTDWDSLSLMFDVAEREFGGADIVCPGAGIYEPNWSNFWHPPGTAESKDSPHGTGHYATFDINLIHPVRTTQLAIARWLNPREGLERASLSNQKRVILISSIAGQAASLSTPLYSASKHAISGFIRALGQLEPEVGICVNGVAPGVVKTPLWTPDKARILNEDVDEWILPEEVAEAMLACVEDPEIGGGYVMEVLKGKRRNVEAKNDPGPSGPGSTVTNRVVLRKEVHQMIAQPGWGVPMS